LTDNIKGSSRIEVDERYIRFTRAMIDIFVVMAAVFCSATAAFLSYLVTGKSFWPVTFLSVTVMTFFGRRILHGAEKAYRGRLAMLATFTDDQGNPAGFMHVEDGK
jgi:hypothetical protein